MGTALGYDFKGFFGSNELADLTLLLTAAAEEDQEQQPPPAKKARGAKKAPPARAAVSDANNIELPGHAMVLAGCSPVFKAQLTRWQQRPAKKRSTRPIITLQVDSPEQLEAASALAQFMYQRCLPEGASQQLLITMLQLADRYDVQMCAVACGDALSKQELQWDTVVCVLELPAAYSEAPLFSDLFSKAGEQLQEQLGDLEEAWISNEQRERFLALPLKGIELLLGDERTRVAYENTVLVAASLWVQQHSDSTTAADKRRLAELIRLPYLTPLFASGVLPSLPWLVDALGTAALFTAMGVGHAVSYSSGSLSSKLELPSASCSMLKWPASWSLGRRPASARKEVQIEWPVSLEELKVVFHDETSKSSDPVFFGGLDWHIYVRYVGSKAAPAEQTAEALRTGALGVYAMPCVPSSLTRTTQKRVPISIIAGSIASARTVQGSGTGVKYGFSGSRIFAAGTGRGWVDFWGVGDSAKWQPEGYAGFADKEGHVALKMNASKFM